MVDAIASAAATSRIHARTFDCRRLTGFSQAAARTSHGDRRGGGNRALAQSRTIIARRLPQRQELRAVSQAHGHNGQTAQDGVTGVVSSEKKENRR